MSRRRTLGALVVAAVVTALVAGVLTRRDSRAPAASAIVTATAQQRNLRAVINAKGALTRSGERTIGYLTSSAGEAPTDAAPPADDQADVDREEAVAAGTLTPVGMTAPRERDTTTTSTTTSTPSTTSTTEPSTPSTTSTTEPSTTTTTSTTEPSTTTTTSTTEPSTTTTPSSTTTTSTTEPRPPAPPEREEEERPERGQGERPADELDGDAATGGAEGGQQEAPRAVVTALAPESSRLERGSVLYAANDVPNIVLLGDRPAWRALEDDTSPGPDVRQLEENLVALGYGTAIAVDEEFTPATAAAVEAWERDVGRAEPDGRVAVGDVTFLPEEAGVLRHEAAVGDTVRPGAPLLTVAALTQTVEVPVAPEDLPSWEAGSGVELTYVDGTTSSGVIAVIGRDATAPEAEPTLTVVVVPTAPPTTEQPDNSPVEVIVPVAERTGVLAVPVAALVDAPDGGIGVRIPYRDATTVVPIEVGLYADGFVEVTSGLAEGDEVVLPG